MTGRRLALAAACGAAVLVPLVYWPGLAAPFLAPKTAAFELMAALAFLAFGLRPRPLWSRGLSWAAAAVLATGALSWALAGHAPHAADALARWAALFGLACGASLVADDVEARQALLEAVAGGAAVVAALGLWQHLELTPLPIPVISTPGSTFGNRNLAAEAMALALPLSLGAAARRPVLVIAVGLELVYLAATRTRGAWIGGAAGIITALALARPRLPRVLVGVALLAIVVALLPGRKNPRYAGDQKRMASGVEIAAQSFDPRSPALRTRVGLWRRSLAMATDHPLFGVGPGNWPVAFPRYAEPGAAADGVLSVGLAPRQAHDDLLERTAETGLVGLAALLALAALTVQAVRRRLPVERTSTAAAAGTLVALAGAGITGFPLEMPATLALAGLALGLVAPVGAERRPWPAWLRAAQLALAAVLLVGAGLRAEAQLRGQLWLGRAERALHADRGEAGARLALPALERARAAIPSEAAVPLREAHMLIRLRRVPEAIDAVRRALALEPDSPNAWAILASAQLAARDAPAARASAGRALELLHEHPYALLVDAMAADAGHDPAAAAASRERLRALTASTDDVTRAAARELVEDHHL